MDEDRGRKFSIPDDGVVNALRVQKHPSMLFDGMFSNALGVA
jgi:hypothetical protein